MAQGRRDRSWASRVFLVVAITVALVGVSLAVLLVTDAQRANRHEAETLTAAVARSVAASPTVADALAGDGDATAVLQPVTDRVLDDVDVDFITIMRVDGVRVTHPDPAQIGGTYLGTIPTEPSSLTEDFVGTLGESMRTIVPVQRDGRLIGWVSAGVTLGNLSDDLAPRLPYVLVVTSAIVVAGLVGAVYARRTTRRVTGDLPADRVRDAVSSYESVRTLSSAMRAQTHEHGNRLHAAVALLELDRVPEAIDLLTETSRRSQALLDRVDLPDRVDPALAALLIGKSSQAAELGIEWTLELDPHAPEAPIGSVDLISVVGNLIDNALDAAGAGPEPRWVDVSTAAAPDGGLQIVVSDSGDGVPPGTTERVFEEGFSTKPVGALGRGVGLPLARAIVAAAGGRLELDDAAPTTFVVHLPPGGPA